MCEQAARYCRAGVQRLLRKPPPALRGLDGLLRWVGARMGDKGLAERELLCPGAAAAQRKGTSVILDVSVPAPPGWGWGCTLAPHPQGRRAPAALPARILHRLGSGLFLGRRVVSRVLEARAGSAWGYSPGPASPCVGPAAADWMGVRMQPGSPGPAPSQPARAGRYFPDSATADVPSGPVSPEPAGQGLHPGSCIHSPSSCTRRLHGQGCTAVPAPSLPDPAPPDRLASVLLLGSCIPGRLGWGAAQVLHVPNWLGAAVPKSSIPFPDPAPLRWLITLLQPGSCPASSRSCIS